MTMLARSAANTPSLLFAGLPSTEGPAAWGEGSGAQAKGRSSSRASPGPGSRSARSSGSSSSSFIPMGEALGFAGFEGSKGDGGSPNTPPARLGLGPLLSRVRRVRASRRAARSQCCSGEKEVEVRDPHGGLGPLGSGQKYCGAASWGQGARRSWAIGVRVVRVGHQGRRGEGRRGLRGAGLRGAVAGGLREGLLRARRPQLLGGVQRAAVSLGGPLEGLGDSQQVGRLAAAGDGDGSGRALPAGGRLQNTLKTEEKTTRDRIITAI